MVSVILILSLREWIMLLSRRKPAILREAEPVWLPDYAVAYADSFYDSVVVGVNRLMSFGAVLSSPVVSGDTVYFGSTDGNLYAVY